MSGRIKLLHLSDRLQYLLVITRLTGVFETFNSEPAAVADFARDLKERGQLCGDRQEVEAQL
jgi:hypothetical protein